MSRFPYTLKSTHGAIPAGTRCQCSRNADRDIVCRFEDGRELVLSAARYCLMGEGVESQLWWRAAVKGLAKVTGREEALVTTELRDLLYALQVNAGPARNNDPWSEISERGQRWLRKFEMIEHATWTLMQVSKKGWRLK